MEMKRVGIFTGSLRKESYSKKIAKALIELAPDSFEIEEAEIGNLPIYNQDFDDEGNPPETWVVFREQLKKYDAVLFITPEYNRSVPAVLKNALDVGSRPYGQSGWYGKPAAVVSVSPGTMGAFGANHHLRQSLVFLNVPTMQQPEAYLANVALLFDSNGVFINEKTRDFLKMFMNSFASWVEMITRKI